ncbi:cilia- and flagella-associated protein 43-like [Venturia canescens]|uniref:cilia- and flagella-associated protein 43-like n=1 Tax=Venturia canescens TaxID=32260 RepID=UPI001C9CF6C4|nr:cilia- and flagella-associated protein 43-like [Venturia canescens]
MEKDEASRRPVWVRGGKIEHVVWVGKDVLAWCSGMHIIFYDIVQKHESFRWCSKIENGDGVSCLSGHPTAHVLAFAEKCLKNPKIFVLSYPSMNIVSECVQVSSKGYVATAFTSGEHLVSLGSCPNFTLSIWLWRSGETLVSVETQIHDLEEQIISVSVSKPFFVGQLGRRSEQVHIWESSPAGKAIILTNHEVILPAGTKPHHMDWSGESREPQLAIVDSSANVYIANRDGSQVLRAILSQRCGICTDFEAPSVRWFRDGIILRTTFCQIRFYRKNDQNSWHKDWYVKSLLKPSVLSVHPLKNAKLFYHTHEGFLMELAVIEGQPDPVIERRLHCGGTYSFLDMIHPWGHHLLAIDDGAKLSVLNCYDGREVAKLDPDLNGEIMQLLSHPDYPVAAVTSKQGDLALVSLQLPESPMIVAKYHLQSERLDLLKFSQCGNYLIAGQRTSGICYCLSLKKHQPFSVIARLETKSRMTDVLLYDVRGSLKLFVLAVSSRKVTVGRFLILYELSSGRRDSVEALTYLELPYAYQFLHYAPEGVSFLIGTPYLSRQLHVLEIRDWQDVNLVDAMFSGHEIRRARLATNRSWIITVAFDGRVTLRNGKSRKLIEAFQNHHRRDLGGAKAIASVSGDLIVSLGRDGSLVGTRLLTKDDSDDQEHANDYYRIAFEEYEEKKPSLLADYSNLEPGILKLLSKRLGEFPPAENGVKKTWVEWSEEQMILEEEKLCAEEKIALRADFVKLQTKLVELLDHNESCPDIERLPIAAFDLDKANHDSRVKLARDERDDARLELEASCVAMDRVTNWIKSNLWDSQKVMARSIFPFSDEIEVTNYASSDENPQSKDMLDQARFFKDSIQNVMDKEIFAPWKLYTRSQLDLVLQRKSGLPRLDEKQRMTALLAVEDEEDQEAVRDEIENRLASEGITTHRYLGRTENHYSQFECSGYIQLLLNSRIFINDCKMLRQYFNEKFDETFFAKEREMSVIRERHQRIRYIDSELRKMFGQSVSNVPLDPDWNEKEHPESIARVSDHEVKVKPYVSASQQEVIDKEAMEAERLRQLLLADDFKEKALIKMMDGVLEVRWEDIIKRDIPKPDCMAMKKPEEYNAEDLLAVRQYDKDVELLENERTRYHRMLETELTKISSTLQEITDKFNSKIHDLFLLKMRVESAIQQLNLRNLRDTLRHLRRMQALAKDDETRVEIVEKSKILTRLKEECQLLQGLVHEYRNQYEALVTREKAIEKKFRSEFPSLGRSNAELLEKECKRRPRVSLKNATPSDLIELGRIAASRGTATYLSYECAEYLKNLDTMDIRPPGMSANIETHHWDHLIRLRRNRIELEMKTRAQMAIVNETEKTIMSHEKKIVDVNTEIDSLKNALLRVRREKIEYDFDMEIQLVLKMGQVEVRPSGGRGDMANVVFIPRNEIESVNQAIVDAGRKKLKAMNRTINFRRGIIFTEWEHKCLRMKIEDLEDELRMVQNVLVTRDMRSFLSTWDGKSTDDKSRQRLEKEIEEMKKNCIKRLNDWIERLPPVEAKIEKVKYENESMDRKIEKMNVDRWELEWQRDIDGEIRQTQYHERVMVVLTKRAKIIRALHKEYTEVLALQTEHELLRLRKFPTLNFFKTLDDDGGVC